ncbi:MAG TPA: hypothetical protein VFE58_04820 [Tepidisphaeraceae bacterium]|jgi:hypothetical protein|nr:hypothetical protein [Tepidisphaeraceae bacterium]
MLRCTLSLCLLLFSLTARAADTSPYAATAQATRTGDKITISIKITQDKMEDVPKIGKTKVTTVLTSSKIVLLVGQRAQLMIGSSPSTTRRTDITSGYQIDVISVKGKDSLLMISTLLDNGSILWADSSTIPITLAK